MPTKAELLKVYRDLLVAAGADDADLDDALAVRALGSRATLWAAIEHRALGLATDRLLARKEGK
jgi:hypothetical protein